MTGCRSESNTIVVDASLVYRLVIDHPTQKIVQAHFQEWLAQEIRLIAPSLWIHEITSAITKAVHFKLVDSEDGKKALNQALTLNIEIATADESLAEAAFSWTLQLGRARAYDSFYLALADAHNAPLWTADGKLVRAVNQDWVKLGTE